jgi:hypothetical protein
MGKRELLLLTGFAAIGVLVYRVTMPASPDGGGGFGAWLTRIRNQVHNEWVERRVEKETETPVGKDVRTLAVEIDRGSLSIIGEARDTAAASVAVVVFGGDEAMAQTLTEQIAVTLVPDGGVLRVTLTLPKREEGARRPQVQVTLRVPARLTVEVRTGGGELDVVGVGAVQAPKAVGRVRFANITGAITGELGPGEIEIDQAGSVTVATRRSDVRVRAVSGAFELEARGGDVRVRGVGGPATFDGQGVDAELEDIGGPVKITGTGGQVRVRASRGPIEADARRMELFLMPALAVPITATTEADSIDLTLPPGGVFLDAVASPGDIRLPEGLLKVERGDEEAKASGAVRGGGPKVTLRTSRGDIVVR